MEVSSTQDATGTLSDATEVSATSSGGGATTGTRARALPFARLALEDFFLLAMVVDGRKEVEGGNNGTRDSRVGALSKLFALRL